MNVWKEISAAHIELPPRPFIISRLILIAFAALTVWAGYRLPHFDWLNVMIIVMGLGVGRNAIRQIIEAFKLSR